jgi:hypothetical protein
VGWFLSSCDSGGPRDAGLAIEEGAATDIEETVAEPTVPLPDYEIISNETDDTPSKVQVAQDIVVSGDITEEGLRALLDLQYRQIMQMRGFRFHNAPTAVYIYLYESRAKAASAGGLWLAARLQSHNGTPDIYVKTDQIAHIGSEPEEKFGLSETKRHEIFTSIVRAERRGRDEAEEQVPLPDPSRAGYSQTTAMAALERQARLEGDLQERYRVQLAAKHNITREQLDSISLEGLKKQWPMPPVQ